MSAMSRAKATATSIITSILPQFLRRKPSAAGLPGSPTSCVWKTMSADNVDSIPPPKHKPQRGHSSRPVTSSPQDALGNVVDAFKDQDFRVVIQLAEDCRAGVAPEAEGLEHLLMVRVAFAHGVLGCSMRCFSFSGVNFILVSLHPLISSYHG